MPHEPERDDDLVIVPDTSVLVDGRITRLVQEGRLRRARVLVPRAVVAELERQANEGRESGFNGLDEIVKLQELKDAADLDVTFVGERPVPEDAAFPGETDAMIRDVAVERGARLVTSDRVQAHVARAMGLDVQWIRPAAQPEESEEDLSQLEILRYFDPQTMSVHLKHRVPPLAKKGTPGDLRLVRLSETPLELGELTRMRRELIEAARRDADSFVEIERSGATVVQLGPMRIAIAQPPFSDGIEITAVRPVTRRSIEDYELTDALRDRFREVQRGVFVSGPPGSGKSTFVTAVAEWLKDQGTVVKTMESPRDLQVSDEITQYAPLDKDMALTSDVLLLVRPDFVVYDEVRRTSDFEVFADMRLAGVGLVGVTHANRGIDAIQRLIGRVELGMIPQVVDTVVHIEKGRVHQVLELAFTVKTPHGMTEADLARPVIEVRDFATRRVEYEIYTYGEQVVVMPVASREGAGGASRSAKDRLAAEALLRRLRRHVEGRCDVEFTGEGSAVLYAEEWEIPRLIGRGGTQVKEIEADVGVKLDIRPLAKGGGGPRAKQRDDAPPWAHKVRGRGARAAVADDEDEEDDEDERWREEAEAVSARSASRERRYAELRPELRKTKKNFVLKLQDARGVTGADVEVVAGGEVLFRATVGSKGEIRVNRNGPQGEAISDALRQKLPIVVRA